MDPVDGIPNNGSEEPAGSAMVISTRLVEEAAPVGWACWRPVRWY